MELLRAANQKLARLYPGDPTGRQPVHTFIGSGETGKKGRKMGRKLARKTGKRLP